MPDDTPDLNDALIPVGDESKRPDSGEGVIVNVHTSKDDDKPQNGRKFLQTVIVTVLGPMALVLVTAWANHRFNVNERKAEAAKDAATTSNVLLSDLKKIIQNARDNETKREQRAALQAQQFAAMIQRIDKTLNVSLIRMALQDQARKITQDRRVGLYTGEAKEILLGQRGELQRRVTAQVQLPGITDAEKARLVEEQTSKFLEDPRFNGGSRRATAPDK